MIPRKTFRTIKRKDGTYEIWKFSAPDITVITIVKVKGGKRNDGNVKGRSIGLRVG